MGNGKSQNEGLLETIKTIWRPPKMRKGAKAMPIKRWGSSLRNSTISSVKAFYPRELTGIPPLFCLPGKLCRDEQSLPSGSGNSTSLQWNLCSQCSSWGIPSSVAAKLGQPFTHQSRVLSARNTRSSKAWFKIWNVHLYLIWYTRVSRDWSGCWGRRGGIELLLSWLE